LLRRLGPVLKHDMVVNLQAISMLAEVLNARLERGSPAPAEFQTPISKLNRLARDAVANCLNVAAWVEPGEDQSIRLRDGVEECLGLLQSNFNFRGFQVRKEIDDADFQVWRITLRQLLVSSLIELTDAQPGPCEVRVTAKVVNGLAGIAVQVSALKDESEAVPFEPGYRKLEWADVQAIAAAESVELVRKAGRIEMQMPRALATAPLQIAPV